MSERTLTTSQPREQYRTSATTARSRSRRPSLRLETVIIYLLLIVAALIAFLPLMWAFSASFTPNDKVFEYAYPFTLRALFPVDFTLEAYQNLFAADFGRAILNTLFLGMAAVTIGGTIAGLAGFAFARFNFRFKTLLFVIVLITFMVPVDLIAIPRYLLVNQLDWTNTWAGILVPVLANSLVIFLFRQFFSEIPQELLDAARVDGANWFRVFFSIVIPISKPVLISAGLLLFLGQWESFFWPLLIARAPEMRVVQAAITAAMQEHRTIWNELLAGSMLAAIIPILLVVPFQKYYIRAIVGTGVAD